MNDKSYNCYVNHISAVLIAPHFVFFWEKAYTERGSSKKTSPRARQSDITNNSLYHERSEKGTAMRKKSYPCEKAERKTDGSINQSAKRSYLEALLKKVQSDLDQIKNRS